MIVPLLFKGIVQRSHLGETLNRKHVTVCFMVFLFGDDNIIEEQSMIKDDLQKRYDK